MKKEVHRPCNLKHPFTWNDVSLEVKIASSQVDDMKVNYLRTLLN